MSQRQRAGISRARLGAAAVPVAVSTTQLGLGTAAPASAAPISQIGSAFVTSDSPTTVQVTAYGWDSKSCHVGCWTSHDGLAMFCFDAAGNRVDTLYDAGYTAASVFGWFVVSIPVENAKADGRGRRQLDVRPSRGPPGRDVRPDEQP